jgi:ribosomal protein S18 acetylase RimI-like enzyme
MPTTVASRGGGWIASLIVWNNFFCSQPYALVAAFQSKIKMVTSCYGTTTPRLMTMRAPLVPLVEFSSVRDFLEEKSAKGPCTDSRGQFFFRNRVELDSSGPYVLGVVEHNDLRDVSKFIVRCFGSDAMHVSSSLSPFERVIVSPVVGLLNEFSKALAVTELYQGLRIRTQSNRNRAQLLEHPEIDNEDVSDPEKEQKLASRSSVVIALARMVSKRESLLDVVAAVELRLQPCDAKIPFALPIIDSFERAIGSLVEVSFGDKDIITLQPYLSNLCVDERLRGQGVGRVLLRAVATIAKRWGYSSIYLHVDQENAIACQLYISEGYQDVRRRWKPFWAGRAAFVRYLVKVV